LTAFWLIEGDFFEEEEAVAAGEKALTSTYLLFAARVRAAVTA
jgi:hypothetical protein